MNTEQKLIHSHLNYLPYLLTVFGTTLIVGLYQLPTLENTANKYGIPLNINDTVPYFKNFQQILEDSKISFSSYFDSEHNQPNIAVVKPHIEQTNPLPTTSLTENISKPTSPENMAEILGLTDSSKPLVNSTNSPEPIALETEKQNIAKMEPVISPNVSKEISPEISTLTTDSNATSSITSSPGCIDNCRVLMLGDSVMGDVSFALQRLLKKQKPSWQVIDAHKVSSGLSNQTYYNWPATAQKLIEQHKPDYTFVLIGTNDAQNFASGGKAHMFGKEDWKIAYRERVSKMIELMTSNGKTWKWIQLPMVRDSSFNNRLQVIRELQEQGAKENTIETQSILGIHNGEVDMKLRANDGTHLNATGANLVAATIYKKLNQNK